MGDLAIQRLRQVATNTAPRSENGETIETEIYTGRLVFHERLGGLRHLLRLELHDLAHEGKSLARHKMLVVKDHRHEGYRWFPLRRGTKVHAVVAPSPDGDARYLLVDLKPVEQGSLGT